jgi:hypothetical protein
LLRPVSRCDLGVTTPRSLLFYAFLLHLPTFHHVWCPLSACCLLPLRCSLHSVPVVTAFLFTVTCVLPPALPCTVVPTLITSFSSVLFDSIGCSLNFVSYCVRSDHRFRCFYVCCTYVRLLHRSHALRDPVHVHRCRSDLVTFASPPLRYRHSRYRLSRSSLFSLPADFTSFTSDFPCCSVHSTVPLGDLSPSLYSTLSYSPYLPAVRCCSIHDSCSTCTSLLLEPLRSGDLPVPVRCSFVRCCLLSLPLPRLPAVTDFRYRFLTSLLFLHLLARCVAISAVHLWVIFLLYHVYLTFVTLRCSLHLRSAIRC